MTAKRNFKRRVREQQLRTGERYTAARRRLLAARAAEPTVAVPVVQLHDVSAEAARLGFQCQVAMFPELLDRIEPAIALAGLRDTLIRTPGEPATVRLFGAAFGVPAAASPEPGYRHTQWRLGMVLGGSSDPDAMLAFHVPGRDGIVPVLCTLWGSKLVLTLVAGEIAVALSGEDTPRLAKRVVLAVGDPVRVTEGPFANFFGTVEAVTDEQTLTVSVSLFGREASVELGVGQVEKTLPAKLFLIYKGQHYAVTTDNLVIGRDHRWPGLAFHDGHVSHRHAAVIRRNGIYYLKDLGSTDGIVYKGMHIDNKRIDEGDVFHLGDYEIRFTYRPDG